MSTEIAQVTGTKKVVINNCFGGFSLSEKAVKVGRSLEYEWALWPNTVLKGEKYEDGSGPAEYGGSYYPECGRDDPRLVEVVERLGDKSGGAHSQLIVVEIPDDVEWTVEEYDGWEHIAEKHRRWPS